MSPSQTTEQFLASSSPRCEAWACVWQRREPSFLSLDPGGALTLLLEENPSSLPHWCSFYSQTLIRETHQSCCDVTLNAQGDVSSFSLAAFFSCQFDQDSCPQYLTNVQPGASDAVFVWTRGSGQTPTGRQTGLTGPNNDRTTGGGQQPPRLPNPLIARHLRLFLRRSHKIILSDRSSALHEAPPAVLAQFLELVTAERRCSLRRLLHVHRGVPSAGPGGPGLPAHRVAVHRQRPQQVPALLVQRVRQRDRRAARLHRRHQRLQQEPARCHPQ